jgi:hypothetical protein
VISDYLYDLYVAGLIKGFAPADHTNLAACDGLLQAGFGLLLGVNLGDQDEQDFNNGTMWTGANNPADPELGHGVWLTRATAGLGPRACWTWAQEQWLDQAWWVGHVDEGWLVITTEEQAAKFTPELWVILASLSGTGTPPPTPPTPTPPPPPTPTPTPPTPSPTPPPPKPTPPPPVILPTGWKKLEEEAIEVLHDIEHEVEELITDLSNNPGTDPQDTAKGVPSEPNPD